MKVIEQYFPMLLFISCSSVFNSFESVDEILKCDHSNECYRAVPYRDAPVSFSPPERMSLGGALTASISRTQTIHEYFCSKFKDLFHYNKKAPVQQHNIRLLITISLVSKVKQYLLPFLDCHTPAILSNVFPLWRNIEQCAY